ncbi:MAG: hypothetical protein KGL39_50190 [Patescibacteria group bacterium]|nr:hypothetical protein [Patescibacteria group bacterium]
MFTAINRAIWLRGGDVFGMRVDPVARLAITNLEKSLAAHTEECGERWRELHKMTQKIQWWVIVTLASSMGVLILGLLRQHGWIQ